MFHIVCHLERWWIIIWRWRLPLSDDYCTLITTREFAECVMHSLIISVGTIWSKWRILLMNIERGWWLFLFWQLLVTNWTDNIHWVIESTVVISLSILSLP